MTTFYLINDVRQLRLNGQSFNMYPGEQVDDSKIDTVTLALEGAVFWPTTDTYVAAAAVIAQKMKARGADEQVLAGIMLGGLAKSLTNNGGVALAGNGLVHVTTQIPLATIQAQTSTVAFNVGAVLPANARLVDLNLNVATPITGGTISAITASVSGGSDAAGSLIASHSVFTGANPTNSPVGSNPYPSRAGQQLKMVLTSTGDTLAHATAGSLNLEIFYAILP